MQKRQHHTIMPPYIIHTKRARCEMGGAQQKTGRVKQWKVQRVTRHTCHPLLLSFCQTLPPPPSHYSQYSTTSFIHSYPSFKGCSIPLHYIPHTRTTVIPITTILHRIQLELQLRNQLRNFLPLLLHRSKVTSEVSLVLAQLFD